MAASNGFGDAFGGPFQNVMNTYFGGFDAAAQGLEPAIKNVARANLEVLGFWNRRAQAWMEIPALMSRCRTPQDVMGMQTQFWQTAAAQYQDSSRKVMTLYAQAMPSMPFAGGKPRQPERDYITFPEPQTEATRAETGRRAA